MFNILYEEFAVYVLYLLVLLNKPLVWKGLVLCTNVCYELAGAEVLVSSARQRREEERRRPENLQPAAETGTGTGQRSAMATVARCQGPDGHTASSHVQLTSESSTSLAKYLGLVSLWINSGIKYFSQWIFFIALSLFT